jgi:hypothetical protein
MSTLKPITLTTSINTQEPPVCLQPQPSEDEPECFAPAGGAYALTPSAISLPALPFILPSLLSLIGCSTFSNSCELSAQTVVPVTSEFSAQETKMLDELVLVDFGLIETLVPGWLCNFNQLHFSVQKAGEEYAGHYDPATQILEVNITPQDVAILLQGDYESQAYLETRARLRYVFLHEMGHHVSAWFIQDRDAKNFGAFSWNYVGEKCDRAMDHKAKNDIGNIVSNDSGAVPSQVMQACFSISPTAVDDDFIGNAYSDTVYGATNLSEDWAQTFAMTVQNIMQEDPDYARDLAAIKEDYYSEIAQQKLDWMERFIYNARDTWANKFPTTDTQVQLKDNEE